MALDRCTLDVCWQLVVTLQVLHTVPSHGSWCRLRCGDCLQRCTMPLDIGFLSLRVCAGLCLAHVHVLPPTRILRVILELPFIPLSARIAFHC